MGFFFILKLFLRGPVQMCFMGLDVFCVTGEPLLLNCEALTHSDDMTLIYWLINGLFPEETSSDDRIVETQE